MRLSQLNKRIILLSLLLSWPGYSILWASEPLTLEACRQAARENGRLEELQQNAEDTRIPGRRLAVSPYQMRASAYGHISYQSDTPDPVSLTDFPFELHPISRFQYHAGILLSLPIYSGGRKRLAARLDQVDRDLEKLSVDRQGLDLDQAVDNLYLSILLGRTGVDILKSQLQAISIKLSDVKEAFAAGKVYRNAVLEIEAKLAALESRIAGSEAELDGSLQALSLLTGLEIGRETLLQVPDVATAGSPVEEDPGLASLELQSRKIELQREFSRASALPSIKAVGTIGFGQWPMNFFSSAPDFYGIVGITLQVPISDWRDVSNRNKMLDNAASAISIRQEEALKQKDVALQQFDSQIAKYTALEEGSRESVKKYEELCEELDILTKQGSVPASDYLSALEQLSSARLEQQLNSFLNLQLRLRRERFVSAL